MAYLLNIEKETLHELKILAVRESRTIREILLEQIDNYIKTHKEGNPQHLITQFQDNEDFMGFPAMAIKTQNKRDYVEKMPEDMRKELRYHTQEWVGILKDFFI